MVQTRSQIVTQNVTQIISRNENDEMEVKVWKIRNEMIGMKNVNVDKKEKITKKIMEILGELDTTTYIEVMMDLFKFEWKFVLKGLMTFEAFRIEFKRMFNYECAIKNVVYLMSDIACPKWIQVQINQFKLDFENLMADFVLCKKYEKFNKVIVEMTSKSGIDHEDIILPSSLGMKVGKFTLLVINPKTKDEYVKVIRYDLMKYEQSKSGSKQRIFWTLQAIEHGVNFVMDYEEVRFKETLISKIKEVKENELINENQKTRLEFLLKVQNQEMDVGHMDKPEFKIQSEIKEINGSEKIKELSTIPVGRARSLEYAKSVFMKKF